MIFDREQRKIYHARLMFARPFIDSLDFALNGREISGEVPVAEMPRLLDTLENPQGILSYTVQGGVDSSGEPLLKVSVAGQCQPCCQRCLNAMDYQVRLNVCLMLRDQAGLDALGDAEDECDSILAEAQLDVLNLLDEEILLSLPIAPRHDDSSVCQAVDGKDMRSEAKHPFAALAKLKVVE
ncbi:MAG TPA: YceD family protein [Gallionella sp.]|nr:YceD family protein [Gallionella sp.]